MLHQDAKSLLCPALPVSYFGNQLQSLTPIQTGHRNAIKCCHLTMLYSPTYVKTSAV